MSAVGVRGLSFVDPLNQAAGRDRDIDARISSRTSVGRSVFLRQTPKERGLHPQARMRGSFLCVWVCALGLALTHGCTDSKCENAPVTCNGGDRGGAGGSGGAGGGGGGGSDGSGGTGGNGTGGNGTGGNGTGGSHDELCGITGTCHDGKIKGQVGYSCSPYTTTCEAGCRAVPGTIQQPDGSFFSINFDLAMQYAREALCEIPDGGVGDTKGDSDGSQQGHQ
jgi:hypothetical protein